MTPSRRVESQTIDTGLSRDGEKAESPCPSEDDLLDLVAGALPEARATAVRAHVLGCSQCQELVGDLAASPDGGAGGARPPLGRGDVVGRYLVLGVLGAGAMGVVYEAYDPELDRKVALKLVRAEAASPARAGELRARLLREAQAMARLAHPNVIAVHDVGSFGDQVFVAMERATGGTLTAWLRAGPRSPEAILDLFVQAGRGLAAAHAAGLVHRDFKPDNVLVGSDGRARVTDFGLARGAEEPAEPEASADGTSGPAAAVTLTRTGVALGTPAYMAPEQIAGLRPDARADIYGFSVALFEALAGERPFAATTMDELREAIVRGAIRDPGRRLSSHLKGVLRRGLAASPEDRWQTMSAMLDALQPKGRGLWRARLALAAVVVLGLAAFGLWRRAAVSACSGASEAWGAVWDEAARERVRAAFVKTGLPHARVAFASLDRAIVERRDAWLGMTTQACEATRLQHTQSEALLDRRTSCLDERRRETAALVGLLEGADATLVERAASAVKALTSLDDCANARALGEDPTPSPEEAVKVRAVSDDLAEGRALRAAGHYHRALDIARRALAAARALNEPRLTAVALFLQGISQEELMAYPDAEASYHEAARTALAIHDDADAADAWMQLSGIASYRREQVAESYLWLGYAEVAIARLGNDHRRRAKLHERRALVEWSLEARLEDADLDYARYLALDRGLPIEEASRFLGRHGPVAFDMGRYDVALRVFEDEIARLEREQGHDHPEMLEAAENRAEILAILGRPREAIPIYRDLLVRFGERAAGYTNHRLAEALRRAGDGEEALAEDELALKLQTADPPGSLNWGQPLTGKGLDLLLLGRPAEALAPLEQAAIVRAKSKLTTARAETDFALARALWDTSKDRPRARALAESARAAYGAAAERYGSRWFATEALTIEAWQKAHQP